MSAGRRLTILAGLLLAGANGGAGAGAGDGAGVDGGAGEPLVAVQYSEPRLNSSWGGDGAGEPEPEPPGMEPLYAATRLFLRTVQPPDAPPAVGAAELERAREAGNVTETLVRLAVEEWPLLIRHHPGLVGLTAAGLLLALLLPLIGLVVCCARCAGSCGGRVQHYDEKLDGCRRPLCGALLALLALVASFGLVAAFIVNERAEDGLQRAPERLRQSNRRLQRYLLNSQTEVRHLLVVNYGELRSALQDALERSGALVEQRLYNVSRAAAVDDLSAVADRLADIRRDLNAVTSGGRQLRAAADELSAGLERIRRRLEQLLAGCRSSSCRRLQQQLPADLSRLSVSAAFRQLPDVSRTAAEVATLLEAGIETELAAGSRRLRQLSEHVQQRLRQLAAEVRQRLSSAGHRLSSFSDDVTATLQGVTSQLRDSDRYVDTADRYIAEYGRYRYYLYVLACCLTAVVVTCLSLALLCGCCGRRAHSAHTCHRGTGANLLLSGAGLFCLYGWLLLLLVSGAFLLGGLAQFYLCDVLARPDGSTGGELLNSLLNQQRRRGRLPAQLDFSDVLSRCDRNESLFAALQLQSVYNSSELQLLSQPPDLRGYLDQLRSKLQVETDVELLSPRAKQQLLQLASSDVGALDYAALSDALSAPVSADQLAVASAALLTAADQLVASESTDVTIGLREQAAAVQLLREPALRLTAAVLQLKNVTLSLEGHVRYGDSSNVTVSVRRLVADAERAQDYLSTRGRQQLQQLAEQLATGFAQLLAGYGGRTRRQLTEEVGRCGAVAAAVAGAEQALCRQLLLQLNSFWAALGWCLLLLLPALPVALRLASLYRKTEPYQKQGLLGSSSSGGKQRDSLQLGYDSSGRYSSPASRGYNTHLQPYRPDSPPYSHVPPRTRARPAAANAPPMWEVTGPPGYADDPEAASAPAAAYDRPPPYFYPGPGAERT